MKGNKKAEQQQQQKKTKQIGGIDGQMVGWTDGYSFDGWMNCGGKK